MNALHAFYRLFPNRPESPVLRPAATVNVPATLQADETASAPRPDRYRQREFGTGYGRSSGYAQDRSYTRGRPQGLLRVS